MAMRRLGLERAGILIAAHRLFKELRRMGAMRPGWPRSMDRAPLANAPAPVHK